MGGRAVGEKPLVSVIIPTKNGAKNIGDCLLSINRSTYRPFEVIVVDGSSQDGTGDIARSLGAKVIVGTGRGRAADCNVGIAEAEGEIVAFTDDDCVVDERWLERLVSCFADPRVGIAGGPDLTYTNGATAVALAAGQIHYFYRALASKTGADAVIGCNSAYRKQALLEVGGFDASAGRHIAEDTELHRRILNRGYLVKYDPACVVHHRRRQTLSSLLKKYWGDGTTMGMVHRRDSSVFRERRRHIYPLAAGILALPVLVTLAIPFEPVRWLVAALGAGYLAFIFGLHRHLTRRSGHGSPFGTFAIASTLSALVYGIAFVKEQFRQTLPKADNRVIGQTGG